MKWTLPFIYQIRLAMEYEINLFFESKLLISLCKTENARSLLVCVYEREELFPASPLVLGFVSRRVRRFKCVVGAWGCQTFWQVRLIAVHASRTLCLVYRLSTEATNDQSKKKKKSPPCVEWNQNVTKLLYLIVIQKIHIERHLFRL